MPDHGLGSRLKRFFFVTSEEEGKQVQPDSAAPEQLEPVEQLAPDTPSFSGVLETPEGQPLDIRAVYAAAGISDEGRFTAEEALRMIRGFPAELPRETQRTTARTALNAVGKSDQEVLQDAAEKIKALETYVETGERELQEMNREAQARIAELERQIAEWRQIIDLKRQQQEDIAQACNQAADELEEVVDFFTPDLPATEGNTS